MTNLDPFGLTNPPSSDPLAIYWELHQDVLKGDEHSAKVADNRRGLIRGATARETAGMIDSSQRALIEQMVTKASLPHFKPLLLVIPFEKVKSLAAPVPISIRARATSEEYIIERLPRACFDILEIKT